MPSKKTPWLVATQGWTRVGLDLGDWRAEATVTAQDGVPVISELRVKPLADLPRGGLTARMLREVALGELLAFGQQKLTGVNPAWLEEQGFTPSADQGLRPGRAGHGVDHYLEVALVYVAAPSRSRTQAVADHFGVAKTTATQKIYDARNKYGLLTGNPTEGVAGGDLTDRAKQLLSERQG